VKKEKDMKEAFIEKKFNRSSISIIIKCNTILSEYARQGYKLSLRQLYYQLVARDFVENTVKSYKRIGGIVSDARLAGDLDWDMIEDRGRESVMPAHWETPAEILESAAYSFKMDKWRGQSNYVEVFVEKDALSGILIPVCRSWDVRFTANKGYSSSSAMYEASKRIIEAANDARNIHIIYLGDHDPSGIDMTRDITDRFDIFLRNDVMFEVHRLALNYEQVEKWNPPENPAKESDSRYADYARKFGESSWELDAVEPKTLADLVNDQINSLIDYEPWNEVAAEEKQYRDELKALAKKYEKPEDDDDDSEDEE
jgi:hypothetical protein